MLSVFVLFNYLFLCSLSRQVGSIISAALFYKKKLTDDTKGAIRDRKSKKDRQYNGEIKTDKRLNNDYKKNKRSSNTNLTKHAGEVRCSGRVAVPAPHVAPVVLQRVNHLGKRLAPMCEQMLRLSLKGIG